MTSRPSAETASQLQHTDLAANQLRKLILSETSLQTATLFSAQMLSTLLNGASSVLTARWLGSENFGVYLFCYISVIQFLGYFFEFGVAAAGARLLALERGTDGERRVLGGMLALGVGIGVLHSVTVALISGVVDLVFNTSVRTLLLQSAAFCAVIPLQFFLEQACQGLNRIKELALLRVILPATSFALIAATVLFEHLNVRDALWATLAGVALGCVTVGGLLKPSFAGLGASVRRILSETRRFGLDIYFGRVTTMASTKLDTLLIPGLLGARMFGFYGIAQKFAEPLANLSRSMSITRFKVFANDTAVKPMILRFNVLLLVCGGLGLVLIGPHLLVFFYSGEYAPAAGLLLPFALGAFFGGLYQPYNSFLSAHGRGGELRNISFLMSAVNCLSLFYIIPRYGLQGGAWMVAVASALNFTLHYYYYCVFVKLMAPQQRLTLVDLSNDPAAARSYVESRYGGYELEELGKEELKTGSKLQWLLRLRQQRRDVFLIFSDRLEWQTRRTPMLIFGLLAGARECLLVDCHGKLVRRTRWTVLLLELPHLVFEAVSSALVVLLSWLLTWLLEVVVALVPFRVRRWQGNNQPSLIFIRTTPTSGAQTGGSNSHIVGFTSGALAEGCSVSFISNDAISGINKDRSPIEVIEPSALFNANRMIFELWNNLTFTVRALARVKRQSPDFIYQRYSRFSWAGVAISRLTGVPLILEYNGSEVWIGRHWDDVSLLWLLERFERLNLAAAQLVFVVSDVERQNLLKAGVDDARIRVNPNGVDPEVFKPDCGGERVRRRLGLERKIIIGFVGTFGPWHGVLVIAEAVKRLASDCHFLLIGEGSLKARVEQMVRENGKEAMVTFTGRLSHKQVPSYLDACDILVSPHVPMEDGSDFFGSPTKLFEYMAMAKPIVASRLGQIADVLEHGRTGLLITPGSVDELVASIELLAQDGHLRETLGSNARSEACATYTWRKNAARVIEAFKRLE